MVLVVTTDRASRQIDELSPNDDQHFETEPGGGETTFFPAIVDNYHSFEKPMIQTPLFSFFRGFSFSSIVKLLEWRGFLACFHLFQYLI